MIVLEFEFDYNNQHYKILVSQPFGAGGSYHVSENNYYIGAIAQYTEGLTPVIQNKTVLTGDDIGVIMDILLGRNT